MNEPATEQEILQVNLAAEIAKYEGERITSDLLRARITELEALNASAMETLDWVQSMLRTLLQALNEQIADIKREAHK